MILGLVIIIFLLSGNPLYFSLSACIGRLCLYTIEYYYIFNIRFISMCFLGNFRVQAFFQSRRIWYAILSQSLTFSDMPFDLLSCNLAVNGIIALWLLVTLPTPGIWKKRKKKKPLSSAYIVTRDTIQGCVFLYQDFDASEIKVIVIRNFMNHWVKHMGEFVWMDKRKEILPGSSFVKFKFLKAQYYRGQVPHHRIPPVSINQLHLPWDTIGLFGIARQCTDWPQVISAFGLVFYFQNVDKQTYVLVGGEDVASIVLPLDRPDPPEPPPVKCVTSGREAIHTGTVGDGANDEKQRLVAAFGCDSRVVWCCFLATVTKSQYISSL